MESFSAYGSISDARRIWFCVAQEDVGKETASTLSNLRVGRSTKKIYFPVAFNMPSEDTAVDSVVDWDSATNKGVITLLNTRWLEQINQEIESDGLDTLFQRFVADVHAKEAEAASPIGGDNFGACRVRPGSFCQASFYDLFKVQPDADSDHTPEIKEEESEPEKTPKTEETTSSWSIFTPFVWTYDAAVWTLSWVFAPAFWLFG
jgi:hypothetical protein